LGEITDEELEVGLLVTFGVVYTCEGIVLKGHETIKDGVYGFVGKFLLGHWVAHMIRTNMVF
jgi:hypothetical protein